MTHQVLLKRGSNSFDLTSGAFSVGLDFSPPAIDTSYNVSSGTSANVNGGGSLISYKRNNRYWSFGLWIFASSLSVAQMHSRALEAFTYAQSSDPLYLEYRTNTAIPVPLWGQFGAPLRYEIVHCNVGKPDERYSASFGRGFVVPIDLELKPAAGGLQQRAANASGGIYEDTLGTVDGSACGLRIPEGQTADNKMTNPIFGAKDADWTASTCAFDTNTDKRFIGWGLYSAKVIAGGAGGLFYQEINAGNTNKHSFSAWVKKPDSSAVTAADCQIYYDSGALASTYTAVGNGVYRVQALNVSGTDTAKAVGVYILPGRTIYLLGYKYEEKAYGTPLSHGDMLGCAWTGVAHDSTTTRTGGAVRIPGGRDVLNTAQWSVSFVWKTGQASTHANDMALMDFTASAAYFFFQASDDKFYMNDGTTTISSAAQTFAENDTLRLVITAGPGGLNVYKNGVNIATAATYTPVTAPANIFIGSSASSGGQCGGQLKGLDIYDTELTAAQVLAMDTEIAAIVTAGRRVSYIPWHWTKDGDGVYDNCDDSTRDNWGAFGGIAGSLAAEFEHYVAPVSYVAGASELFSYYLGGMDLPVDTFVYPTLNWFYDLNGTASGAGDCGGGYTGYSSGTSAITKTLDRPDLSHYPLNFFVRMSKAATSGNVTVIAQAASGSQLISALSKTLALTTVRRMYYAGSVTTPETMVKPGNTKYEFNDTMAFTLRLTTTFDVQVDYVHVIPGYLVRLDWDFANPTSNFIYNGRKAMAIHSSLNTSQGAVPVTGDTLRMLPNRTNLLWGITVGDVTTGHLITATMTFQTFVTPQYALL